MHCWPAHTRRWCLIAASESCLTTGAAAGFGTRLWPLCTFAARLRCESPHEIFPTRGHVTGRCWLRPCVRELPASPAVARCFWGKHRHASPCLPDTVQLSYHDTTLLRRSNELRMCCWNGLHSSVLSPCRLPLSVSALYVCRIKTLIRCAGMLLTHGADRRVVGLRHGMQY